MFVLPRFVLVPPLLDPKWTNEDTHVMVRLKMGIFSLCIPQIEPLLKTTGEISLGPLQHVSPGKPQGYGSIHHVWRRFWRRESRPPKYLVLPEIARQHLIY